MFRQLTLSVLCVCILKHHKIVADPIALTYNSTDVIDFPVQIFAYSFMMLDANTVHLDKKLSNVSGYSISVFVFSTSFQHVILIIYI